MKKALICVRCGSSFTVELGRPPIRCKPCQAIHKREGSKARQAAWRAANPERAKEIQNKYNRARLLDDEYRRLNRERMVLATYGITQAQLEALIERQHGFCAICGGPPNGPGTRLHIDHCHDTGRIRGMLCAKCNTMIGLADNDPCRLRDAADYLKE